MTLERDERGAAERRGAGDGRDFQQRTRPVTQEEDGVSKIVSVRFTEGGRKSETNGVKEKQQEEYVDEEEEVAG